MRQNMLDMYIFYVNERDKIQHRKDANLPRPWTTDPVLDHYHFCNNRREDDRGTKEIREVVLEDFATDLSDLPMVYTAARLFNKADTLKAYLNGGVDLLKELRETGPIFHTAYVVSTCGKSMDKVDYVEEIIQKVWETHIPRTSCRAAYEALTSIDGLGSFLSGQIIADLKNDRYLVGVPDWERFAVIGPGSKKGLDIIFGPGTCESNFTQRLDLLLLVTTGKIPSGLHLQDLQNTLCEFSKYVRHTLNLGGRKRPYHANNSL